MKRILVLCLAAILLAAVHARCQDFVNLSIQGAYNLPPKGGSGAVTNLLPGWSAFEGTTALSTIPYDQLSRPAVTFQLAGFTGYEPNNADFAVWLSEAGFSISQSGSVPADAKSLLFDASATFSATPFYVSLGGQDLSCSTIATGMNGSGVSYNVYAADVSAFAGDEETLSFSSDVGGGIFNDIQFSPMPIPEPGEIGMLAWGIVGFGFYRWRRLDLRRRER